MGEALRVGGDGELFDEERLTGGDLYVVPLDRLEHIPEGLRFSDLDEYSDRFRDVIKSRHPYLSADEIHPYSFTDVNGMGRSHMVLARRYEDTYNRVQVALQAVPPIRPEDVSRHSEAFRQLQASMEALEQVSLVESAVWNGSTDCTFTYDTENHVPFMSLIDVVFDNPDIMPTRAPSLET